MKRIQLGGHNKGYKIRGYAIVDDEDFAYLNQWRWYFNSRGYATKKKKQKIIYMHRLIINTPKGMETDHINGNGLDNRRSNLRICTRSQNAINTGKYKTNTSGYKGVSWDKKNKKWRVQIKYNGIKFHLKEFSNKYIASKIRKRIERKLFGKFAHQELLRKRLNEL